MVGDDSSTSDIAISSVPVGDPVPVPILPPQEKTWSAEDEHPVWSQENPPVERLNFFQLGFYRIVLYFTLIQQMNDLLKLPNLTNPTSILSYLAMFATALMTAGVIIPAWVTSGLFIVITFGVLVFTDRKDLPHYIAAVAQAIGSIALAVFGNAVPPALLPLVNQALGWFISLISFLVPGQIALQAGNNSPAVAAPVPAPCA